MRYISLIPNPDDPSKLDLTVIGHSDSAHDGFTPRELSAGKYVVLTPAEATERFGGFDPTAVD